MGILDDLKRMLRRETADAKEWLDESLAGANAGLDRAERRIAADPNERLQATLDDITANDDAFAALQAKADAATAGPAAQADLDADPPADADARANDSPAEDPAAEDPAADDT
ncbi:MAG TPA: hypothetical protein VMM13_13540 [Euzebya sp.]|nr:hypothetical protein [Euzebya sp.]